MNEISAQLTNKKQIYFGVIFSYCLIILNALYSLLLTPFIVGLVGDASFGVYKTISAFSAALMVVDLGIGSTAQRYIAKFLTNNESKEKIRGFLGLMFTETLIISLVAGIVLVVLFFNIKNIYGRGLEPSEIESAEKIFAVLSFTVIIHLFENVTSGAIAGHNRFLFLNGFKLIRILLRFVLTYVGLVIFKSVMVLCWLDLFLVLILFLLESFYLIFGLKLIPLFSRKPISFDLIKESAKYSGQSFVTEIVNQINGNLDSVVIGALISSSSVTIYSIAIIIFAMFEQVASTVSSVLLPKVTSILSNDKNNITSYIVKVGRIQFMLVGSIFGGFIVLGKIFLRIWMGNGFEDAYYISLILMVPAIFELCVNVCLAVLRASNRLAYRTKVLILMLVINTIITLLGVYYFGYYFAAIGTAISCIVGNIILMNRYYYKEFGFDMKKIYLCIFSRLWICVLLSSVASYFATFISNNDYISFVFGGFVFVAVYVACLLLFGFNKDEKVALHSLIRRVFKKHA